jgi:hypothetical protein
VLGNHILTSSNKSPSRHPQDRCNGEADQGSSKREPPLGHHRTRQPRGGGQYARRRGQLRAEPSCASAQCQDRTEPSAQAAAAIRRSAMSLNCNQSGSSSRLYGTAGTSLTGPGAMMPPSGSSTPRPNSRTHIRRTQRLLASRSLVGRSRVNWIRERRK